ncbi:hypothetical protein M622_08395 [Thauera terpenica 58Eu]|jgi:SH3-like domain-containing protein|uniref:SH3b domain-containing protein n=1 Tax=Thauera terpenica 58Eu TaxID=1348657 RepID=S9ZJQ0_9RHOO|nr:SH3 domain-containing protein [Thauera terpenica]EPZ13707.1 hypothetical protein M622_08395 [Thauera terpenica 58Eu]MBP6726137.1 hypothetical protein [Thauera sp.]
MPLLRRKLLPSLATTLLAFSGLTAGAAQAIEFRSLTEAAIVYDAPSTEGRRLFILRPGTPVEIVVTLDQWIKVREPSGSLSWIERRVLAKRRTLLVTAERAAIRREARDDAPLSFEAARNVVVELIEAPTLGWARVRHADGLEGYIRASDVWGL